MPVNQVCDDYNYMSAKRDFVALICSMPTLHGSHLAGCGSFAENFLM